MLDAHPQLAIPPETHFNTIFLSLAKQEGVIEDRGRDVFEAITGSERWPDFQLDAAALRREVSLLAPDCTIAEALRTFYRLCAARHGKPRWGDKTPGHLAAIVEIGELLPEARIIHLVR